MSTQSLRRAPALILFWVGILLFGVWVFFGAFVPSLQKRRETRTFVQSLRNENAALRTERDRLSTESKALEDGDRRTIERELRRIGYVPANRVRLQNADAPLPPPPGTAPKGARR